MRAMSTARDRARAKATAWLLSAKEEHGGLPVGVAAGIINTLDKTPGLSPNIKALQSMGSAGLAQLRASVEGDLAAVAAKRAGMQEVALRVDIPRECAWLELSAYEGDTIKEVAEEFTELAEVRGGFPSLIVRLPARHHPCAHPRSPNACAFARSIWR